MELAELRRVVDVLKQSSAEAAADGDACTSTRTRLESEARPATASLIPYRYYHLPYRSGHDTVIFHIDTVILWSSSISIRSLFTSILSFKGRLPH